MTDIKPLTENPRIFKIFLPDQMTLGTINLTPKKKVYTERLILGDDNIEYRTWDAKKSKLASAILSGLQCDFLHEGTKVLYLGASTGTTVSHVSDIIGENGIIYAVEYAPAPTKSLLSLAAKRPNIIPILGDARYPENYAHLASKVDLVYVDVAQPNQAELLIKNANYYLKKGGKTFIAIKTKSISQTKSYNEIITEVRKYLQEKGLTELAVIDITNYHKEHAVILSQLD